MYSSSVLQGFVFILGVLFLLLHAGPLLRIFYRPSIRGGTRWQFFGAECLLFLGWFVAFPVVAQSLAGRIAVALHIATHLLYTLIDRFAHDFLIDSALACRKRRPVMWVAKEMGLLVDTLTHLFMVCLTASVLPRAVVPVAVVLALGLYAVVTRGYLRAFGPASEVL